MSSSTPATEHTALGGNAGAGYGAADHEVDVGPLAQSLTAHETRAVDVAVSEVQRRRDKEKRVLTGAMIFCFVFMVLEFVAGVIAHSLALLTDALHLLTDVGAYGLSIAALVTASRVACGKYNYGWHRAEVIGTLISVFSIWALVLWIVVEAVQRIYDIIACSRVPGQLVAHETIKTEQIVKGKAPSSATSGVTLPGEAVRQCTAIDSRLMIVVGFLGMLVNIVCASILYFGGAHGHSHGGGASHGHSHGSHEHGHEDHAHDHDHDHDHDHGHDHGHGSGDSERGFAVRSAILHALGDCIQSLGVILAGFYIYAANQYSFKTHSYKYSLHNLADPLASIFFAVVTVNMTRSLLMDLLGILMETTPPGVDYQGLEAALRQINGVKSVHDLHVWSLSPDYAALSVHLVAEAEDVQQAILKKAKELIKGRFGISHSTIQVDCEGAEGDRCAGGCELPEDCKSPLINHRH